MINALNRDLPYDQFVIDQIAGDLLPNATQDQMVATGFLRNSMINEEGGIDPEQFRMEAMFDRMDAIGKGILGAHDSVRAVPQPQVRSAEAGRVLPDVCVSESDSHEANVAVYTPAEADEARRKLCGGRANWKARSAAAAIRDWQKRMAAWERIRPKQISPNGRWSTRRSMTFRQAARSICR